MCYIGIGSNLVNRRGNILKALELINKEPGIVFNKCSSIIETEPWGYGNQPKFLNMAAEIETTLAPAALLTVLKSVEKKVGRKKTFKWGPRTIDLDILFYGNRRVNAPSLKIPHPQMKNRRFVMDSLKELEK
jgi:2-amino-4-hydroxy-6-hydroxymethyldihydropteridine diphosphokinase